MLGRRQVRERVLDVLFAERYQTLSVDNRLQAYDQSIVAIEKLYFVLLDMIQEMIWLDSQQPHTPPSFSNSRFGIWLDNQPEYKAYCNRRAINWRLEEFFLRDFLKKIKQHEAYQSWMDHIESISQERHCLLALIQDVIFDNEVFIDFLEDQDIGWVNGMDVSVGMLIKSIERLDIRPNQSIRGKIMDVYKDLDDKKLGYDLIRLSLENKDFLDGVISQYSKNWKMDRIASIDVTLLIMALTEIYFIPHLPARVTINEYVEMAKDYAMDYSPKFINGMLDTIIKDLIKNDQLNKDNNEI